MFDSLKKAIQSMPPIAKYLFMALVAILFVAIWFYLGFQIGALIFETNIGGFLKSIGDINQPHHVAIVRYFMAMQTIGLFGILPVVLFLAIDKPFFSSFGLHKISQVRFVIVAILIMLVAIPAINFLGELNSSILDLLLGPNNALKQKEADSQLLVETVLNDNSLPGYILNLIIVAFLPAAFEEFFFRGFLQKNIFYRFVNKHVAIITVGVIFSFFHFQFYGFIPRMLLGILFGYILLWSESLWLCIIMHFMNNAIAVTAYYLIAIKYVDKDFETIGTQANSYLGMISFVLVAPLVVYLYRQRILLKGNNQNQNR